MNAAVQVPARAVGANVFSPTDCDGSCGTSFVVTLLLTTSLFLPQTQSGFPPLLQSAATFPNVTAPLLLGFSATRCSGQAVSVFLSHVDTCFELMPAPLLVANFASESRFYLWLIVLYWIWVFYFLGGYLKTRSFTTLYDRYSNSQTFQLFAQFYNSRRSTPRVASNQLKFLFGNDANAMFGTYQELAKKTIYMGVHLVFGCFTMLLAFFFWYFWWAQFTFICLMISLSCFNASKFYLSAFDDEIMRRR